MDVFITYAKRSAIGRFGGTLSSVRVDDLLAKLLIDFKQVANFDVAEIDDVLIGCANQAGEDNRNLARMALILADYPYSVPGATLNRLCGSSLDAVIDGFCRIRAGFNQALLIGGAESMSRAPYVFSKADTAYARDQKIYDTSIGWRFPNPEMKKRIPLLSMGETAECVAKEKKISRADQDEFAYHSHQKAIQAIENGLFEDEIVPITIQQKKAELIFKRDEGPRADSTLDQLAKLKPAFSKEAEATVTAGNSSSINDGASLLMMCSKDFLKRHHLKPLARVHDGALAGLDPNVMGLGPIYACEKLFKKSSLKPHDFSSIELNEAFAAQALACVRGLDLDPSVVNPLGGAIALGHPLGSSGTRLVVTLIHHLKRKKGVQLGLASMCIGMGQGVAASFEINI